eukprot:Opistho-2@78305
MPCDDNVTHCLNNADGADKEIQCTQCGKKVNSKTYLRHFATKHADLSSLSVTLVDTKRLMFLVRKASTGPASPVHCQLRPGELPAFMCGKAECMSNWNLMVQDKKPEWHCKHANAARAHRNWAALVKQPQPAISLQTKYLTELLERNNVTQECHDQLLDLDGAATKVNTSMLVKFQDPVMATSSASYFSVFSGLERQTAAKGDALPIVEDTIRTLVTIPDRTDVATIGKVLKASWHCECQVAQAKGKKACVHIHAVMWHLVQELLVAQGVECGDVARVEDGDVGARAAGLAVPSAPKARTYCSYVSIGEAKANMKYLLTHKMIPFTSISALNIAPSLPNNNELWASESVCHNLECNGEPLCRGPTTPGKIYDRDNQTYMVTLISRQCKRCSRIYRYQTSEHGVFNFNNKKLFTLRFMAHIKTQFHNGVPFQEMAQMIRDLHHPCSLPPTQDLINAYAAFEALLDQELPPCPKCGFFPPVLVLDNCAKVCYERPKNITLQDMRDRVPKNFDGQVNIKDAWTRVKMAALVHGVASHLAATFQLAPSLHETAMIVHPMASFSDTALNSEYLKGGNGQAEGPMLRQQLLANVTDESKKEMAQLAAKISDNLSSGHLTNKALIKLCKEAGFQRSSSCNREELEQMLTRYVGEVHAIVWDTPFIKAFPSSGHKSGGLYSAVCPHRMATAVKPLERGEGMGDGADVMRSLKHPATVFVYDAADNLALYANKIEPLLIPSPDLGRLDAVGANEWQHKLVCHGDPSDDQAATPIELPEGLSRFEMPHPLTRTAVRKIVYDGFHLTNSTNPRDAQRDPKLLLSGTRGHLNTPAAEQFNKALGERALHLNKLSFSRFLLLQRSRIIGLNRVKAAAMLRRMRQELDKSEAAYIVDSHPRWGYAVFTQKTVDDEEMAD